MKELAILKIRSHRSTGKTETKYRKFWSASFHIFCSLARPAAFVSTWLIMEFDVTPCFWCHACEKFCTLHIASSILEFMLNGQLNADALQIVILNPFVVDQCSHNGSGWSGGRYGVVTHGSLSAGQGYFSPVEWEFCPIQKIVIMPISSYDLKMKGGGDGLAAFILSLPSKRLWDSCVPETVKTHEYNYPLTLL